MNLSPRPVYSSTFKSKTCATRLRFRLKTSWDRLEKLVSPYTASQRVLPAWNWRGRGCPTPPTHPARPQEAELASLTIVVVIIFTINVTIITMFADFEPDLILLTIYWPPQPQQSRHLFTNNHLTIRTSRWDIELIEYGSCHAILPLPHHLWQWSRNVAEPSSHWLLGPQGPPMQTDRTSPALERNH